MMPRWVVLSLLLLAPRAVAQSPEELAMFQFLEAERAFQAKSYPRCVTLLADAERHLGRSNPKIDALAARCLFGAGRFAEAREAVRRYFASRPDPQLVEYRELGELAVQLDEKLAEEQRETEARAREAEARARAEQEARERERLADERRREEAARRAEEEARARLSDAEQRRGRLVEERAAALLAAEHAEADASGRLFWVGLNGALSLASIVATLGGLGLLLVVADANDRGENLDLPLLLSSIALLVGGVVGTVFFTMGASEHWDAREASEQAAAAKRHRVRDIDRELSRGAPQALLIPHGGR